MAINFPDSPSLNDLYTDETSGFTYQWDGEVWKSYVDATIGNVTKLDDISGSFDGNTTTFALTVNGAAAVADLDPAVVFLSLGGIVQNPVQDYTISGTNITFSTAPAGGLTFFATYHESGISKDYISSGIVGPTGLSTGGFSWNTSGDLYISGVSTISNTGAASTALYVSGNARIAGILTVGSSSITFDGTNNRITGTGITISSDGIVSGIITATTYSGDGVNLVGAGLGTESSINTTGIITASKFSGDATYMTDVGGILDGIVYSPGVGATSVAFASNIEITFNKPIQTGVGTITLRTDAADGTIVESYDISSSDRLTISSAKLTIDPTDNLSGLTTYFVVVPTGTVKDLYDTSSNPVIDDYSFTTIIDPTYALFVSGRNEDYGQLGLNDLVHRSSPTQVPGTQWAMVAAHRYSVNGAYKNDGTLWMWGYNDWGNLGLNDNIYRSSPTQVPGTQWSYSEYLHSGYQDFVSTKTDGTLWAWGRNGNGQLAQNNITPDYSSPIQIPGTQWNQVFRGSSKTFATKTDGTLWIWGYNGFSSLGLNDSNPRSSPTQLPGTQWKMVNGNLYNTLATKTDGTAWVWGRDQGGCLGLNSAGTAYASPVQLPGTQWDVLYSDTYNSTHSIGYKTDGTLWSWGYNSSGQLGQNDKAQYSSPRQIPGTQWTNKVRTAQDSMTSAIKDDGTLWVWGVGGYGSLGQNDRTQYSSPIQIPGTQWYRTANSGRTLYAIKQTT